MNAPANELSLWAFACELYSDKREQVRLLEAQNTYQISICAVLWCQWLDVYKKPLLLSEFESGLALCRSVDQSVLTPLRAIRNQPAISVTTHYAFENTKKTLLHTELQLEKELLGSLEVLTSSNINGVVGDTGFLSYFLQSQPQAVKVLLAPLNE